MYVSSNKGVNAIRQHEGLERVSNVLLVRSGPGAPHGPVSYSNDPRCFSTVDTGKVPGHPLVLFVRGDIVDASVSAIDVAEWTSVSNVSLLLCWHGLAGRCLAGKRVLGTFDEVGLTVK